MKRLTSKLFLGFVNSEFKRLEMENYEAIEVRRSHFTTDQYEGGACRLYVHFKDNRYPSNELIKPYFYCFYSLKQYESFTKQGYEMYLTFRYRSNKMSMQDLEVDVRKIKHTNHT